MLEWNDYGADWPDIPYPNFNAWLTGMEEMWQDKDALLFRPGKQKDFTRWTFRYLADQCRRIGRGLIKAGLKKGDRVALWAENRPEWMAVWLGTVITGCVIVPVDVLVSEKECANIIKITGARAFFYSERKREFALSLAGRGLDLDAMVCIDTGADTGEGNSSSPAGESPFMRFGSGAGDTALPGPESIDEHDPASIVFTSGTTGFAKGVTLHHRGIILNSSAAIRMLKAVDTDVFITVLPLHHTYPTTCSFISPLIIGATTVIVDKLVGKVVVDDTRDSGGTILIAVPLLYDKLKAGIEAGYNKLPPPLRWVLNGIRRKALAEAQKGNADYGRKKLRFIRKKAGFDSIRLSVAGGGALNPKTADFFDSFGFNLVNGYGMSENSPLISVSTDRFKRNASVGLPVKYTEVKIIDPDENGIGEIAIKSPSIMLGYYENPEATKEVLGEDGWLYTGDLGYRDSEGYIYISGRKKNLIVSSGGKNIYPEEIELCFDGSGIVGEILVLGRKAELAGEDIFAVVVPNRESLAEAYPGKIAKEGELSGEAREFIRTLVKREIERVNRTLPGYKKISDFTLRYEEFEKNAQKKIRRFLYKDYARK
ncbi:MAG: AMP-binding protein [Treponema sp.]|jgi:long-chain acyl-CoA synthetase|nr:AMP-binding protein [Treponema sp.]